MSDQNNARPPRVFISYSWDDEQHKDWVLSLATRLRQDGIDVRLDRWELRLGKDRTLFMERAIAESDYVLLICTPTYADKANKRERGVGWEALIITGALAEVIDQHKFIPVLRSGDWNISVPGWMKTRLGVDLRDDSNEDDYQGLLRELHGELLVAPPIGQRPDFNPAAAAPQRRKPFSPRGDSNSPGRFKEPQASLGINWDSTIMGSRTVRKIFLDAGPVLWLRVLPQLQPSRTWSPVELKDAGTKNGSWLTPFFGSSFSYLRSDEGFGMYTSIDPQGENAFGVAFAFETGEVWCVDTYLLSHEEIYFTEIVKEFTAKLPSFATFLHRLGIDGPYHWIAGVAGAQDKKLVPSEQAFWAKPTFLSPLVVSEGEYSIGQDPNAALHTFFSRVFEKCGLNPPPIFQLQRSPSTHSGPKANAIAYGFYEKVGTSEQVQTYVRPVLNASHRFSLETSSREQVEGSQQEIAAAFVATDLALRTEGFTRRQTANLSGSLLFNLP